jgi:hypothetical protein
VSNDLVAVFLLSLVAMVNPTLLAAVTVMLLMANPKRPCSATCWRPHDEHHDRPAGRVLAAWIQRGEHLKANDQPGSGHRGRFAVSRARMGSADGT